jgi:GNAT superfamily N-acetyltransferase
MQITVRQSHELPLDVVVEAVKRLMPQLHYQSFLRCDEQNIDRLREDATDVLFVAVIDCVPIGMLTLVTNARLYGITSKIEDVVVDENYRNRGACTALIEAAHVYAQDRGSVHLQLQSEDHRTAAHRVYYKFGYESEPTNVFDRWTDR